jgi:hypothetical protein
MEDKIEITVKRFNYLIKRDLKLSALESGGVDNWSGYDDAMAELYRESEED